MKIRMCSITGCIHANKGEYLGVMAGSAPHPSITGRQRAVVSASPVQPHDQGMTSADREADVGGTTNERCIWHVFVFDDPFFAILANEPNAGAASAIVRWSEASIRRYHRRLGTGLARDRKGVSALGKFRWWAVNLAGAHPKCNLCSWRAPCDSRNRSLFSRQRSVIFEPRPEVLRIAAPYFLRANVPQSIA
jgi:hypothetical protein